MFLRDEKVKPFDKLRVKRGVGEITSLAGQAGCRAGIVSFNSQSSILNAQFNSRSPVTVLFQYLKENTFCLLQVLAHHVSGEFPVTDLDGSQDVFMAGK